MEKAVRCCPAGSGEPLDFPPLGKGKRAHALSGGLGRKLRVGPKSIHGCQKNPGRGGEGLDFGLQRLERRGKGGSERCYGGGAGPHLTMGTD